MHNEKVELPPVSGMVDIVGGKYVGHVGVVERYTPMMVEVRLFHGLAEVGAVKTLNPVVMIRQYNIQLRVRRRVDIVGGKYVGHVGVVERYTPMMVEVRLFRGLAEAGAVKTLNPVVMIRQYNIQLPVLRERTDILAKVTYMLS
jgi:hypothetical protein